MPAGAGSVPRLVRFGDTILAPASGFPRSRQAAQGTLGIQRVDCFHAGTGTFPLAKGIRAVAFSQMGSEIEPLQGPALSSLRGEMRAQKLALPP